MSDDSCSIGAVNGTISGSPFPISCNDNNREQHQSKPVVNRTQPLETWCQRSTTHPEHEDFLIERSLPAQSQDRSVLTATSPSVLLYPTRKHSGFLAFGDEKKCVHQYKPPEVGIADPRSAIASPTTKMRPDGRNQPHTKPAGPAGREYTSVAAMEGTSAMILKATPKTSRTEKLRRSSCLYPSFAMRCEFTIGWSRVGRGDYPGLRHRPRSPIQARWWLPISAPRLLEMIGP